MPDCRIYTLEDVDQIVELLQQHMPSPRYSHDYFRWKFSYRFDHDDQVMRPIGVVAAENGTVIGFAAFVPYRLCGPGLVWNLDDVVVHSAHRRRGVVRELTGFGLALVDDRREPTYLVSSPQARRAYLSMGFEELFDIDEFFLISRWSLLLGARSKAARLVGTYLDRVLGRIRRDAVRPALEAQMVESIPEGLECAGQTAGGWTSFRKDAAFLSWRFSRHPVRRYELYLLRSDGEVVGYVVLSNGAVMDFAVSDDRLYADLFAFSAAHFRHIGVPVSRLLMHGPDLVAEQARRAGFLRSGRRWLSPLPGTTPTVMVRDVACTGPTQSCARLFLRAADIDCGY
jgi:GNAT superfamily N-acetyltransferase